VLIIGAYIEVSRAKLKVFRVEVDFLSIVDIFLLIK
jgi:hypothetical protein